MPVRRWNSLTGTGMLVTGCAGPAWVAFAGLALAGLFAFRAIVYAILIAVLMVLVAIGLRNVLPFLPGRRK